MSSNLSAAVVAKRYARALLEVALEQKLDTEAIADELTEFNQFIQTNAELTRVLSAATIAAPNRVTRRMRAPGRIERKSFIAFHAPSVWF